MIGLLTYLDCEATSTDPATARIVELCIKMPGHEAWTRRINPGIPIPPESTAVHGISDADVVDCPTFAELAGEVQGMLVERSAALCGYSSRRYDVPLLDAELKRAGQAGFRRGVDGRLKLREVDVYQIWQRLEARTLVSAAKRFAGVDLENAHSADADTLVLPDVLAGMLAAFDMMKIHGGGPTIDELCELSMPEGEVDRDGKFRRDPEGVIRFTFGKKTRGVPVHDDPGFLSWMLRNDFPAETKGWAQQFLDEIDAREEARRQALLAEDGLQLVGVQPELPF